MNILKKSRFVLLIFFCLSTLLMIDTKAAEIVSSSDIIETKRLHVTPLSLSDIESWYDSIGGRKSSCPFWKKDEDINNIKDRFRSEILPYFEELKKNNNPLIRYTVRLKEEGCYVGRIHFSFDEAGFAEINYSLVEKFWGQGFATELVGAMLTYIKSFIGTEINHIVDNIEGNFVWKKITLKAIWARVEDTNLASLKICEKFLQPINQIETYTKRENEKLFIFK